MRINNGVVVPEYNPDFIPAAIEFVGRAQLQGREALICADLIRFLGAVQAGHYTIVAATPGVPAAQADAPSAAKGSKAAKVAVPASAPEADANG